jgi:outer membrane lipoprotein carrier protein
MKRYLAVLGLSLLPWWSIAQTAPAIDELLDSLQGIEQLQGGFEQRQYTDKDVLLVESSGTFRLLRPGYFAWEIESPDSQLIIASPEFIWHHDRDLETATRRPVSDSAEMSPLQVLGGDESALREKFTVERAGTDEFILTPQISDVGFKQLTLQLEDGQITGMVIRDNLDHRVVIEFTLSDVGRTLTSADFAFTPPEGVDVFYYDE